MNPSTNESSFAAARSQGMQILGGVSALSGQSASTVVALGNFDGVHLGHQAIIAAAVSRARELSARAAVFTFWPHPQQVLRKEAEGASPAAAKELICLREERAELIAGLGADLLVEQPFDAEFARLEAEEFFKGILIRRLGAVGLVVGYDFAFGRGRAGNIGLLRSLCESAGIELKVVEALQVEGEPVSSSRIRKLIAVGDVETAAHLLGRPFFYRGSVVRGDGRGSQIGIPTANLPMPEKIRVPNGVYATRVRLEGHPEPIPAVTNVGVRPTFYASAGTPLIETHFLDEKVDAYDKRIQVDFIMRIREERRFSGVEELKARIAEDIRIARAHLKI